MADTQRKRLPLLALGAVVLTTCALAALCAWFKLIPVKCETWVDTKYVRVEQRYTTMGIRWAVKRPPDLNVIGDLYSHLTQVDESQASWIRTSLRKQWLAKNIWIPLDNDFEHVVLELSMLCSYGRYSEHISHAPDREYQLTDQAREEISEQVVDLLCSGLSWNGLRDYLDATDFQFERAGDKLERSNPASESGCLNVEITQDLVIPADTWLADPVLEHYLELD